ncbi:OR4 protein [Vespula squamosa]|uniref:OR4 protein n=1 Tax=Vespula squamosa TaxID=30214 RepID=A0ABD2BE39_VESSQ
MCMVGYYMIKGWNNVSMINMLTYVTLLTSFMFNIFIICYIGELLADECKKMAESTYMINWYQLKGKKALSLILIISMSLSSSRLTAGKFIELSLRSFGDNHTSEDHLKIILISSAYNNFIFCYIEKLLTEQYLHVYTNIENPTASQRHHFRSALALARIKVAGTRISFRQRLQSASCTQTVIMHDRLGDSRDNNSEIENKNYQKDIRYVLQLCRWIIKPIGIWPLIYDGATKMEIIISIVLSFACISCLCFVLIPSGLHTLIYEKNINIKLKLFGPVGFCLTSTIKYCYLGIKGRAIGRCIGYMDKDWRHVRDEDYRRIMIKHATVGRNLTILCASFLYSGGMSYHTIMPLFSRKKIDENHTIRPLTYPGYDHFIESQVSPTYEIIFFTHCIYALITYNITTATCSLAATFVSHVCGQVQIIISRLDDLVDGKKNENTVLGDRLAVIIQEHVKVLRFSEQVEEVLREVCLMELVASTLIICLLQYYCMTEWSNNDAVAILTYFILLVSFTFNIFIFCYIGELLVNQCRKIGAASYNIEWYRLSANKGLDLVLLIAIANYPPKITAGKIFELSLATFGRVSSKIVARISELNPSIKLTLFNRSSASHRSRSRGMDKKLKEDDKGYVIKPCRYVLKPIGLWPMIYKRVSRTEKIISAILAVTSFSSVCFVLIPAGLYMFFYERNINIKLKLFGPLGYCLTSTIKYCYLGLKGEAIGRCIAHVENDWETILDQNHRAIMKKYATVGRNLTVLCALFLYSGGMSYHTIMTLSSSKKINDTLTIRALTYPGYDRYFDVQASPAYEIVFFLHCVCAMVMHSITTGACSLAATFVTHACGQIQIIMTRLNDLVEGKESGDIKLSDRMAIIVRDHAKTLRFSVEVEKVLREVCLLELVASTLIICLLEYYCITEWENNDRIATMTYFILLVSFTFNIFIFCYIGELLVDQCKKVGAASYNIEWYRLPRNVSLSLILLIAISNYPPKITAGKLFELSLLTFGSENDMNYAIQLCRFVLKPIGLWPMVYKRVSSVEKILSAVLAIACFSTVCFVLLPAGIYMLFYEHDINTKLKLFGPVGFCLTSTFQYCYLGLKGKAIGGCIAHVENDWKMVHDLNHRAIMKEYATLGRNLTVLCALFLFSGGMSYHTVMTLSSSKKINETLTIRALAYPGYDRYFDIQASPTYEIIFFLHCVCAMVMYSITTAACSLAATFVTHACGQIQIVMTRLSDLVEGKESNNIELNDRLVIIVRDHAKTLRFSVQVEEVLREVCLLELIACTWNICLLEYYCMMEWENNDPIATLTYLILLISFTFNIFIFCYIGELLVDQCKKVGAASYNVEWYRLPKNIGLGLILLIAISNYPPKITAGKLFELSLFTFGSVLKTSLVYLNLIRTITD